MVYQEMLPAIDFLPLYIIKTWFCKIIKKTEVSMDMAYTVEQFLDFLKEEKSDATISKYTYELQMFAILGKREIGKELMIQYRTYLSSRYRPQTVNGKLSAVNAFLKFTGLYEYRVKFLKVQRRAYIDETRGTDAEGV